MWSQWALESILMNKAGGSDGIQLSYFKSWKMMLWKCCTQYASKIGKRLSDFTFTFHFHALEKEMATHSSVLAWISPGTWEPGGLPSMGSHRVGHDWSDLAAAAAAEAEDIRKRWQEYTEELYKKDLHDPDNHTGVITQLEPDILECEVSGP